MSDEQGLLAAIWQGTARRNDAPRVRRLARRESGARARTRRVHPRADARRAPIEEGYSGRRWTLRGRLQTLWEQHGRGIPPRAAGSLAGVRIPPRVRRPVVDTHERKFFSRSSPSRRTPRRGELKVTRELNSALPSFLSSEQFRRVSVLKVGHDDDLVRALVASPHAGNLTELRLNQATTADVSLLAVADNLGRNCAGWTCRCPAGRGRGRAVRRCHSRLQLTNFDPSGPRPSGPIACGQWVRCEFCTIERLRLGNKHRAGARRSGRGGPSPVGHSRDCGTFPWPSSVRRLPSRSPRGPSAASPAGTRTASEPEREGGLGPRPGGIPRTCGTWTGSRCGRRTRSGKRSRVF